MKKINQTTGKISKILCCLALYTILASAALVWIVPVLAQDNSSLIESINQVGKKTELPSFDTSAHQNASYESGASNITSAILFATDLLKYLVGSIAILVIIIQGVKLVTATKKVDDASTKAKENLKYAVIGLLVVMTADVLIKNVIFGEQGETLRSQTDAQLAAQRGTELIRGIYNFMEYFLGAVAILMIVFQAVRLIAANGNEDALKKVKSRLTYAIIGLMMVGVAEFVIKDIVFPKEGSAMVDVTKANQLIIQITNFASGFVATIAVAMLMYGGYVYVTDMGKGQGPAKAKKIIFSAIIGLVIALGAYAIINTIISFNSPPSP